MPGPVELAEPIRAAFAQPPISHRAGEFVDQYEAVRTRLLNLAGASRVALFQGSGTLANDVIAGTLQGPGLVLVNGEFGARSANQARAWNLKVRTLEWAWGQPWDLDHVASSLQGIRWVWAVHLETSTGMVNDYRALRDLLQARGIRLCLDCVSALGAVPVDLNGVWLASGVSGKALGSFAGVGMVFASEVPPARTVPVYMDLNAALETEGPRFTFSSPLLAALDAALKMDRNYHPLGDLVRSKLRERDWEPMVDAPLAAPTVTTFVPPTPTFLDRCKELGYWIGGESGYLRKRGLVQIATMGAVASAHIEEFFHHVG